MHTTPHNGRDTVTTDLSADVIRAVNKSVAILGCYTTLGGNARVGRLQSAGVKQNEIKLTTLIDTDFGIYDIEAQTLSENEVLLHCATSRHYLVQFKWDIESNFVEQVYCSTPVAKNVEEEVFYVGTCIAETAEFDRVAGGSTSGRVCIFKEGRETQIFQAHDNECWSLRFLDRNLLLSGSEAGSISFWDLRRPLSTAAACQRSHDGGVVAMRVVGEHNFVTGGYDEYIRLWDQRMLGQELTGTKCGGVWDFVSDEHSLNESTALR